MECSKSPTTRVNIMAPAGGSYVRLNEFDSYACGHCNVHFNDKHMPGNAQNNLGL